MSISSRFAVAAHILALLELSKGKPVTSEWIAGSVNTNPAVVRRLLGMLAKAGLTSSQLGTGGGALLKRPADSITLLDVYRAVDPGTLFTMHHETPNPACTVGRHVQTALEGTLGDAQRALEAELGKKTIAEMVHEILAIEGQEPQVLSER